MPCHVEQEEDKDPEGALPEEEGPVRLRRRLPQVRQLLGRVSLPPVLPPGHPGL